MTDKEQNGKISFADLEGKVGVITGGGGIIGTALAYAFVKAGIKLAILDLDEKAAQNTALELKKQCGTEVIGITGNVLKEDSLKQAKEIINTRLGRIDILINCAGGNSPKATTRVEMIDEKSMHNLKNTFYGLDLDGFRQVFELNLVGTLLPTMVFTTDMIEAQKGVILNISSMNSFKPLTKIPAYSSAKASINNFTQWLGTHLAKMNIRVNALAPGFFLTNQNRFLLIDEKTEKLTERGQKIINGTPMGKFGQPDDLCGAALFLVSDISSFMTGVILPVDGGFNAYSGV